MPNPPPTACLLGDLALPRSPALLCISINGLMGLSFTKKSPGLTLRICFSQVRGGAWKTVAEPLEKVTMKIRKCRRQGLALSSSPQHLELLARPREQQGLREYLLEESWLL